MGGRVVPLPPARQLLGVTISLLVVDLTIAVARRLPLGGGETLERVGGKVRGERIKVICAAACLMVRTILAQVVVHLFEPLDFFSRPLPPARQLFFKFNFL